VARCRKFSALGITNSHKTGRPNIDPGKPAGSGVTFADISAIAVGGAVRGNGPTTSAAMRPSSAPDMTLMPSGCMAANLRYHRLPSIRGAASLPKHRVLDALTDS